jgi:hypothetical protein
MLPAPNVPAQPKLDTSRGTLLPLPALYLFGAPVYCLGGGSCDSSWNFHLVSCIGWFPPGLANDRDELPLVRVYELALNDDCGRA